MSLNSLYHANTASGKPSYLVIIGDTDNYFSSATTVALDDSQTDAPSFTVKKVTPFSNNRNLLIRYTCTRPTRPTSGGASTPPVESGALTVTISNPSTTTVVGVAYVDDATP